MLEQPIRALPDGGLVQKRRWAHSAQCALPALPCIGRQGVLYLFLCQIQLLYLSHYSVHCVDENMCGTVAPLALVHGGVLADAVSARE